MSDLFSNFFTLAMLFCVFAVLLSLKECLFVRIFVDVCGGFVLVLCISAPTIGIFVGFWPLGLGFI